MKYFILSLCLVEKVGSRVRTNALSVKEEMSEAMTDSTFKTIGDSLHCDLQSPGPCPPLLVSPTQQDGL